MDNFKKYVRDCFESTDYGRQVLAWATELANSNNHYNEESYLINAISFMIERLEEINGLTTFKVDE